METRSRKLHNIAIASYHLSDTSISINGDIGSGGSLQVKIDATATILDDHDYLDKDHPFIIDTKISVIGQSRSKNDSTEDDLPDVDVEEIFSLLTSARGVFEVPDNEKIHEDEVLEYVNYLAPQVYLPLREYVVDSLVRMGVTVNLPLQTQYAMKKIQSKK